MWPFGGESKSLNKTSDPWKVLEDASQIDQLMTDSADKTVVIFKHSTSCATSALAKSRLQSKWSYPPEQVDFYYLDLLKHRQLSNAIAERFRVRHESPQLLVIVNGRCVHHVSHLGVSVSQVTPYI